MGKFSYTAVIRTLGRAGDKYQQLLDSLLLQSIPPAKIIVYIAEGYPIPEQTCGAEEYVYVPKGMVAQRALQYTEVETTYILMLDDDVYLPPDAVEKLFRQMKQYDGDVISPDVFHNADRSRKSEIMMKLSGRIGVRRRDEDWGYMVMPNAGYSYNKQPKSVMKSQTNAGPCLLCKKMDFLRIHFEDELWLDEMKYALGEDQVMFYKMYLHGLMVLTSYDSEIVHLDAGTSVKSEEREQVLAYCDCRFKMIFWRKFIWNQRQGIHKASAMIFFCCTIFVNLLLSLIKFQTSIFRQKFSGYRDGFHYQIC